MPLLWQLLTLLCEGITDARKRRDQREHLYRLHCIFFDGSKINKKCPNGYRLI